MKPSFIWDLDGTLLDSYPIIVDSLYQVYKEKLGIELDKDRIHREIIKYSVSHFLNDLEKETGIKFDALKDRYSYISGKEKLNIPLMKNGLEILKHLKEQGIHSYVFTHRGVSTEPVLRNLGIYDYFDEVVASINQFKRKPDPEGINYLIDKYHLDKDNTYYVGDRAIDIECANNAHIKSIMFIPSDSPGEPTGKETIVINDLLDIKKIA